ncbi:MAG: DUF2235 domain-containing protein [Mangrovicoccus sp.]|nr:DUF2235 domain-containing protein [Mangrovicoccus sp.]
MTTLTRITRFLRGLAPKQTLRAEPINRRPARDLVVILDGTMSRLEPGHETNAGLIYKLLKSGQHKDLSLYYEAGLQWRTWREGWDMFRGRGLNAQIQRAYGFLASNYRPGDRIWLFGYSRGAFAVRSLAGLIDRVGLLRSKFATERHVQFAYRHYRCDPHGQASRAFARRYCYIHTEIEMVGVFDTVKALGLRLPVLWRLTEAAHAFHSHHLGHKIRHGYQALALDETRAAFAPELWSATQDLPGHVEQVWFRGTHGDIGGQLSGQLAARPLANIPLAWMLGRAEMLGLKLPEGWRGRFPCDASAPSSGSWRGWSRLFLLRGRRKPGGDPSERIHPTAQDSRSAKRFALPPSNGLEI